jgi:hypothetical protein
MRCARPYDNNGFFSQGNFVETKKISKFVNEFILRTYWIHFENESERNRCNKVHSSDGKPRSIPRLKREKVLTQLVAQLGLAGKTPIKTYKYRQNWFNPNNHFAQPSNQSFVLQSRAVYSIRSADKDGEPKDAAQQKPRKGKKIGVKFIKTAKLSFVHKFLTIFCSVLFRFDLFTTCGFFPCRFGSFSPILWVFNVTKMSIRLLLLFVFDLNREVNSNFVRFSFPLL